MQDNIITWNFPNWVTITLMALIGFFALGAAMAVLKKRSGSLDDSAQTAQ
jgi:hypothetical protein